MHLRLRQRCHAQMAQQHWLVPVARSLFVSILQPGLQLRVDAIRVVMSSRIKHFRNQTRHFNSLSTHRSDYTLYRPVFRGSRSPRQLQFYLQGLQRLEPPQRPARPPVVRRSCALLDQLRTLAASCSSVLHRQLAGWLCRSLGVWTVPIRSPSRLSDRALRALPYPTTSALAEAVRLGARCHPGKAGY